MRLRLLRDRQGWSQSELARRSGVSQTYISELEAGKKQPTVPIVRRLAAALGVTVGDLIGEAESKATGTDG